MKLPFSNQSIATLLDVAQARAEQQHGETGFSFHENSAAHSMTYGRLGLQARSIAAALQGQVSQGERALLLYAPGLDYIAAFLACIHAGVVAVPTYPPSSERSSARLRAVLADARAATILTCSGMLEQLRTKYPDLACDARYRCIATDQVGEDGAADWKRPDLKADDLAMLQYTSGSTARPKGVRLSHANLLSNLDIIRRAFDLDRESKGAIWLPPYHDMGLVGGILAPLFVGFPVALMSPMAFMRRPGRWLELVASEKASCSGAPNFAYDLCVQKTTPEFRASLDLSSWRVAFCGAEPVRAASLTAFSDAFAAARFRSRAFYPCYGLAESTLMVSGGTVSDRPVVERFSDDALCRNLAETDRMGRALVSCGRVRDGLQLEIVDGDSGTALPEARVGQIVVRGASVSAGYWSQVPRADAWLETGDLGFLWKGELFVTGRLKEALIIRGRNYSPQDIEATVQAAHDALEAGAGVAFSTGHEELVIVQEVRRTHRQTAQSGILPAIREALAREHGLAPTQILLAWPGSLEKTPSGKLQRVLARERYLRGEIVRMPNAEMSSRNPATFDNLVSRLAALCQLPCEQIADQHSLLQLGLDSLKVMEFLNSIPKQAGVTPEAIFSGMTVGEIRRRLDALRVGAA